MNGPHLAGVAPRWNKGWLGPDYHPRRRFVGGVEGFDIWVIHAVTTREGHTTPYATPYISSIRICFGEGTANFTYFWIDSRKLVNPDALHNPVPATLRRTLPLIHNFLALFVPESFLVPLDEAEGRELYGVTDGT